MATIDVGTVDVFVLARVDAQWMALVLQRGPDTRCPESWETVHGHIEPGEEPEQAAARELWEETGLRPERLYSVRVTPIYLARTRVVQLGIGFAAIVSRNAPITLGAEHGACAWLSVHDAERRFAWPSERAGLAECVMLLREGDAGPLEDVLRVR